MIKGKVIQFRRGRHTVHERHFLIEVESVKTREEAGKLVGKEVEWKSPVGKIIKGKISSAHGLDELNKLDRTNLYNVRIGGEKDTDKKYKLGLTSEKIQLMVNSKLYEEIYMVEIYNDLQELAKRAAS